MAYSFSQLGVYQSCPRKYQYKYLDKITTEQEPDSADLLLGQYVHSALERLYNQLNNYNNPDLDALLATYQSLRDARTARQDTDPIIIKGQHSSLGDYIQRGRHYLQQYRAKHTPFTDTKILGTEMRFTFEILPEVSFRGVIDRLDKDGDTLIINDYKTNKQLPPADNHDYQHQLTLYATGIRDKYGKYATKIKARLHYLHADVVDERDINPEQQNTVLSTYREIIKQIEHVRFQYNMGDREVFVPIKQKNCNYCEYRSICPLWAHASMDDEDVPELNHTTIKKLIDRYGTLAATKNNAEKQLEALRPVLLAYLHKHGLKQLFGEEYTLGYTQSSSLSIKDKETLTTILSQLGMLDQVWDIDRFKLQRLIKEGKLSPQQLGSTAELKPVNILKSGKKK